VIYDTLLTYVRHSLRRNIQPYLTNAFSGYSIRLCCRSNWEHECLCRAAGIMQRASVNIHNLSCTGKTAALRGNPTAYPHRPARITYSPPGIQPGGFDREQVLQPLGPRTGVICISFPCTDGKKWLIWPWDYSQPAPNEFCRWQWRVDNDRNVVTLSTRTMKNISLTTMLISLYGHAGIFTRKFHLQPSPVAARPKGMRLRPFPCWDCGFE
jgi:hypothetical protein